MKKFLALVMAMLMILAMGTGALAEEAYYSESVPVNLEEEFDIVITKQYAEGDKVSETLTFTPKADDANPSKGNLIVGSIVVENGTSKSNLSITIPALSEAGTYKWTIKEDIGSTAGVKYSSETITVNAVVGYDNDNSQYKVIKANAYIKNASGSKTYAINNAYSQVGSFAVKKEVTGTGARMDDEFDIKVILTVPEGMVIGAPIIVEDKEVSASEWKNGVYTYTIEDITADQGAATFKNIPAGVSVKVTETDQEGYTCKSITVDNVASTTKGEATGTIGVDQNTVFVVTNEKDVGAIETGLFLDNAPYMMIMALVVLAGAAMLLKKRAYND